MVSSIVLYNTVSLSLLMNLQLLSFSAEVNNAKQSFENLSKEGLRTLVDPMPYLTLKCLAARVVSRHAARLERLRLHSARLRHDAKRSQNLAKFFRKAKALLERCEPKLRAARACRRQLSPSPASFASCVLKHIFYATNNPKKRVLRFEDTLSPKNRTPEERLKSRLNRSRKALLRTQVRA